MFADFTLGQNALFYGSLLVTVALAVIEGILLMVGLSSAGTSDLDGVDSTGDGPSESLKVLGYLNVGRLPLSLFIASSCAVFGLTGLAIQQTALQVFGATLPIILAGPIALIVALPSTRWLSRLLGRWMPRTETSALSRQELIGLTAEVVLGDARPGSPAQAKVRDGFGQTHYVMIEPAEDEILQAGQMVLLTQKQASIYLAAPTNRSEVI